MSLLLPDFDAKDIKRKAKQIWPEVGEGTRVLPTFKQCDTFGVLDIGGIDYIDLIRADGISFDRWGYGELTDTLVVMKPLDPPAYIAKWTGAAWEAIQPNTT